MYSLITPNASIYSNDMKFNILKNRYLLFFICLFISFVTFGQTDKGIPENSSNNILIINSYTESSIWSNFFLNGIYDAIQKREEQYLIYNEHMNMIMIETEASLENIWTGISEKYENLPLNTIIMIGNPSWALLGDRIREKWKNTHIILCLEENFTGPREHYLDKTAIPEDQKVPFEKAAKDKLLTVMYSPIYIKETVSLMKQMIPEMKKIIFLSDGRYISAQNRLELGEVIDTNFSDLEVDDLESGTVSTDSLIKVLSEARKDTGILFSSWYQKNVQGANVFILMNIYRMLGSYTKLPIFALKDAGVADRGLLGGFFNTQAELEGMASNTVGDVLSGKTFDQVITPPPPRTVINYLTLLDKGFSENDVPSNTSFYMKPPTFWDKYKFYIIGLFVVFVLLYLYKDLNDRRRLKLMGKYRSLFNNMPVAYLKLKLIYDSSGHAVDARIVEMNPSFGVLFNSKDELKGKKISKLGNGDSVRMLGLLQMIDENRHKITFQYYVKETDRHLNIILTTSESEDLFEIFCMDNTQLAKLQQALSDANYKLAMSLEVANLMPWKWDLKDHLIVCDVGDSFGHINVNLTDEEQVTFTEDNYFSRVNEEDRERVLQAFNDLISGKVDKLKEEYRLLIQNKYEWLEVQAVAGSRTDERAATMLVGSSQIITKRKELQEELVLAKLRAEESNRLKSAFLANMSHEIRTPLNAIVGFSGILASAEEEDEKKEYVNIIESNNALLLQLIGDILDLSKIEAGTLEFVYMDVDLNAMLKEQEQVFSLRVNRDAVQVEFEESMQNCYIHTEKNRLLQVLGNLINNSIKFTEKGTIQFGYKLLENNFLYFYVKDTGCGIPATKLDGVFGRFVKLNSFIQGTGLGLSICKTIVEHMGGEIGVESQEGVGSKFWFTLPYKPSEISLTPEVYEEIEKETVDRKRLKVLIAEDNPGNYKLFESILKRDYELIHAWDGEEAVRLFKENNPHIVLMDINMPIMDGYEATRLIREQSPAVPVIAVTAYAFSTDEQRISKSGFSGYMAKPISADKLKIQMKNLLSKRLIFI